MTNVQVPEVPVEVERFETLTFMLVVADESEAPFFEIAFSLAFPVCLGLAGDIFSLQGPLPRLTGEALEPALLFIFNLL